MTAFACAMGAAGVLLMAGLAALEGMTNGLSESF